MLGDIPYQWRHSCAANAWFLWFIHVAVVFYYGCWDSFGEDLGRRREHPQWAHRGDCLKSFMKFVLIKEMVKMEEITHRVEEEATIHVLRQAKGASETQRSSSDCSKQAKEKVKKEKEAEKKRKRKEYNQQVYRRIENIKKDCEEVIAAKRAKLEKRVAALTEAMATCKTEKESLSENCNNFQKIATMGIFLRCQSQCHPKVLQIKWYHYMRNTRK